VADQGGGHAARARIEHQVFDAGLLDFLGQVGQLVQRVADDGQRRIVLAGQVGHGLPVGGVRAVDQRAFAVDGAQAGGHHRRVAGHQDQRAGAGGANRAHGLGEHSGVAALRFDSEAIQGEGHADIRDVVAVGGGDLRLDVVGSGAVAHPDEQAGLVEELLLMAEKHGLVAYLDLVAVRAQRDQADGRLGGL